MLHINVKYRQTLHEIALEIDYFGVTISNFCILFLVEFTFNQFLKATHL